ncbi:hypothetical protein OIY81_2823 [Cryptosporidium canis]|nr:hypothetical protein OIY81_2823 [Cryptosporidium canis]
MASSNSRQFKERLRRELIEKHVRGIESSSLISLKFQERLIENEERLSGEIRSKIQSFLRPCDLEEVSIERSGRGVCGWIQCRRRISGGSSAHSNGKWALDKGSGQIIDRSILSLFCSTSCYYSYLDLSISLSDTHPHLRAEVLADIQKWLSLDNLDEETGKETETEKQDSKETVSTTKVVHSSSVSTITGDNLPKDVAHDVSLAVGESQEEGSSSIKAENTKGPKDLENLLDSIRAFKNTNKLYKFDRIVKHFDYLNIEESDPNECKPPKSAGDESKEAQTAPNCSDLLDDQKNQETQDELEEPVESEDSDEFDDPEYTYQDMMQVLRDANQDESDSSCDDEECPDASSMKGAEKHGETADHPEKKGKRSCDSQDYILLMTQFYDNLSPEVVVLDLLTSLISEETRELVKSGSIVEYTKSSTKELNRENNEESELDTIQIDRRNVLKDNLSGYIASVEWISNTKLLVFTIYKILDTFIFPFSIPSIKQSCLELLTFILIDVIMDNESHFNVTNYFESFQDEIKAKAQQWISEVQKKYDGKFIENIKLLFTNKD